jgi:CheY-like chemotaxis protein
VVDDNVDTAVGMTRLLELQGHEVHTAYNGAEALRVAREQSPEFVLLDIGLPEMDGYEVARRLRQEEGCQHTVIVAVSGYGREEDHDNGSRTAFDHHLLKPVDRDALLTILSETRDDAPKDCAHHGAPRSRARSALECLGKFDTSC